MVRAVLLLAVLLAAAQRLDDALPFQAAAPFSDVLAHRHRAARPHEWLTRQVRQTPALPLRLRRGGCGNPHEHVGIANCISTDMLRPLDRLTAVLFDVDGTLIDSNAAHAETWAQALTEHGLPRNAADVRPLIGMGSDKLLPAIAGLDEDSPKGRAVAQRKKQLFAGRLPRLHATRGARMLVESLKDQRKSIVIATSADEEEMDALLQQAGVADLIPRRTSSDDAEHSKPDADIVLAALRRAGSRPGATVMIGDTPYDVEAAARAGIDTIALRCGGHWSKGDLAGAIAVFDDPADLRAEWRPGTRLI